MHYITVLGYNSDTKKIVTHPKGENQALYSMVAYEYAGNPVNGALHVVQKMIGFNISASDLGYHNYLLSGIDTYPLYSFDAVSRTEYRTRIKSTWVDRSYIVRSNDAVLMAALLRVECDMGISFKKPDECSDLQTEMEGL